MKMVAIRRPLVTAEILLLEKDTMVPGLRRLPGEIGGWVLLGPRIAGDNGEARAGTLMLSC